MLADKFDPYGELLSDDADSKSDGSQNAPMLIARVGQVLFWALALAIVFVRIRYFPEGIHF